VPTFWDNLEYYHIDIKLASFHALTRKGDVLYCDM